MKAIYTLLILLIPFVGFGQNGLDEIQYIDWSIKKVKIIEENPKNIKYRHKNEDLIITEDIDKISKIIFSSGRVKKFKDKIGPNPKLLKQKIKNDSILKLNKKVELKKYKEKFLKNSRSSLTINSGLSFSNVKYFEGIFKSIDTRFKIGHYHSLKYNFKISRHNFSVQTSFIQKGYKYETEFYNPVDDFLVNYMTYFKYNYLNFSSTYNLNKIISQKMIINFDLGPSIDFYISDIAFEEDNPMTGIIIEDENIYTDNQGFNEYGLGLFSSTTLSYMIDNIHLGIGFSVNYSISKVLNTDDSVFNFITFTNYLSISYLFD